MTFKVKDSGERLDYPSGMRRDIQKGKPRYDLIDREFLRRWAMHMMLGAEKYGEENWRLADSQDELTRFRSSAVRHMMQWLNGETDEDHAAAVAFNIAAAEYVKEKLKSQLVITGEGEATRITTLEELQEKFWPDEDIEKLAKIMPGRPRRKNEKS